VHGWPAQKVGHDRWGWERLALADGQAKKKPRPKARQFIREETPRKGRGVSDASQRQSRVRRTIDQAKNACVGRENARNVHLFGIINALIAQSS
jgi:hypothetical protein